MVSYIAIHRLSPWWCGSGGGGGNGGDDGDDGDDGDVMNGDEW